MKSPATKRLDLGIVILSYNVKDDLLECLKSVFASKTALAYRVYVVDNGSTDGSVAKVKKAFRQLTVLETGENLGFTGGNNLGIKKALVDGVEFVLILNPDTTISPNLLADLWREARSDNQIGIVSPKIYFASGYEYHDHYQTKDLGKVFWYAGGVFDANNILSSHRGVNEVDAGQFEKSWRADYVSGCAMLVRKEVFEQVGFFDDDYFLYLEDLEFSWRVKQAGFKLLYVPAQAVWHKNAQSAQIGSKLQDYYITRNRLLFATRYASLRTKLAIYKEALKFLLSTNQTKREAVWDFVFGKRGRRKTT